MYCMSTLNNSRHIFVPIAPLQKLTLHTGFHLSRQTLESTFTVHDGHGRQSVSPMAVVADAVKSLAPAAAPDWVANVVAVARGLPGPV